MQNNLAKKEEPREELFPCGLKAGILTTKTVRSSKGTIAWCADTTEMDTICCFDDGSKDIIASLWRAQAAVFKGIGK